MTRLWLYTGIAIDNFINDYTKTGSIVVKANIGGQEVMKPSPE